MGYESRLYIVDKGKREFCPKFGPIAGKVIKSPGEMIRDEYGYTKEMWYAQFVACFDLSESGLEGRFHEYPATDCFIYESDGNTKIIRDKYGDRLNEIPIADCLAILEDACEKDDYRRFKICRDMLQSFYDNKEDWDELVVLHYGY